MGKSRESNRSSLSESTVEVQPELPKPNFRADLFPTFTSDQVLPACGPKSRLGTVPPGAGQPGLLTPRLSCGPIIVCQLNKASLGHEPSPGVQRVITSIPSPIPTLNIVSPRVRGEEHPPVLSVDRSSPKTLGNSWVGTWNKDAFAKTPSKWATGSDRARKS